MKIKPCYVYLLATCDDGPAKSPKSYVGWTHDLEARLAKHNSGTGAKTTRGRHWQLVHSECFKTRSQAMSREALLKRNTTERRQLLAKATNRQ